MGRKCELGEGVLDYLERYPFTGNVRELENMIEQGMALAVDGVIRRDDIIPPEVALGAAPSVAEGSRMMQDVVDEAETGAIRAALREVGGNRERAAEMLGLSATTLWRKMKRLKIEASKTA